MDTWFVYRCCHCTVGEFCIREKLQKGVLPLSDIHLQLGVDVWLHFPSGGILVLAQSGKTSGFFFYTNWQSLLYPKPSIRNLPDSSPRFSQTLPASLDKIVSEDSK